MRALTALSVLVLALSPAASAQTRAARTAVHLQPLIEPLEATTTNGPRPQSQLASPLAMAVQGPRGSIEASAGLGLVLGAAGFVAGGFAAGKLADCDGEDFCGLEAAFHGAAAFGTAGLALGVHLGNARQGNYGLDLLTAAGVWAAGYGLARADGFDSPLSTTVLVLIPVMQLVATISVERAEGRAGERDRVSPPSVNVGLDGRGGLALDISTRF